MATIITKKNMRSVKSLIFKTCDQYRGKDLYYISVAGVALSNVKGKSNKWSGKKIYFKLKIPTNKIPKSPFVPGTTTPIFRAKNNTVFASLNSVYNKDHSVNSGHAVDRFRLLYSNNITDEIWIECDVAVRDKDAYLYRVGFKVELLIYFDKWIALNHKASSTTKFIKSM